MKNNKIILAGCSLLLATTISLVGCSNSKGGNSTPSGPTDQETENQETSKAERKAMSNYFEGLKIYGETDLDYDALFNRQADALAQDITHRLHVIYGISTRTGDEYTIQDNYCIDGGGDFIHKTSDHKANISYDHLLTNEYIDVSEKLNKNFRITDIKAYQKSLLISRTGHVINDDDYFDSRIGFRLPGAIYGKNCGMMDNGSKFPIFVDAKSEGWLIQDELEMKNKLIEGIKKLTFHSYHESLGFSNRFTEELIAFIKTNIIGDNLVRKDQEYEDVLVTEGKITYQTFNTLDASFPGKLHEVVTYHERLYKGYNIILNAILNEALNNKFTGEDVSIYPTFNKFRIKTQTTFNVPKVKEDTSIFLMPKKDTPLSKIWYKTNASTSKQTINIQIKVSSNGFENKKLTQTIEANKEYELNLTTMGRTSVSKYNGEKENNITEDIFLNNDIAEPNNGKYYISITFKNVTSPFSIEFSGINSAR